MENLTELSQGIGTGYFEIISLENVRDVWRSGPMPNLMLDAHFQNLIQHHNGVTTVPLAITSLEIGDGSTAVNASDTALANLVLAGVVPAKFTASGKSATIEFFVVDAELPDGTYRELGLRTGSILATRALFTTPYVKASGRDTIIRYTVSYDAA